MRIHVGKATITGSVQKWVNPNSSSPSYQNVRGRITVSLSRAIMTQNLGILEEKYRKNMETISAILNLQYYGPGLFEMMMEGHVHKYTPNEISIKTFTKYLEKIWFNKIKQP